MICEKKFQKRKFVGDENLKFASSEIRNSVLTAISKIRSDLHDDIKYSKFRNLRKVIGTFRFFIRCVIFRLFLITTTCFLEFFRPDAGIGFCYAAKHEPPVKLNIP